jgi:chemotaxis-related protein WspD
MSDPSRVRPTTEIFNVGEDQPSPAGGAGALDDCWNRIGVSGDRSCPELETHIHCRNCPVFASAARAFFDRPAPEGYLTEWTDWLASAPAPGEDPEDDASSATRGEVVSMLIFRLGAEWLAVGTRAVAEVTTPRPIHRIPHRSDEILTGLVNLRGQLQLCVSLHGLLGVAADGAGDGGASKSEVAGPIASTASKSRLVVLRDRERSEFWVFPADEVVGIHRVARNRLCAVPATLADPAVSYSQAVLPWEEKSVGLLDEQRIFTALRSFDR